MSLRIIYVLGFTHLVESAAASDQVTSEKLAQLEELKEYVRAFKGDDFKRLSKGKPLNQKTFDKLEASVAELIAEAVESEDPSINVVEDLLPLQSSLEEILDVRAKDAEVPDQLEEDLTEQLKIKSDELDEVQSWIGTNNDAPEAVSRLEKLEEFYSSLDHRYVDVKDEKLEAIDHLKRIAKRRESLKSKQKASEEESQLLTPDKRTFIFSRRGCKDALAYITEELRMAEKSLLSAKVFLDILNSKGIPFLRLCKERGLSVTEEKLQIIIAKRGRLEAVLMAPLNAIEGILVALPEAFRDLEMDNAETMIAEFERILEYRQTLPITKKQKAHLDGYYATLEKVKSYLPQYREFEAQLSLVGEYETIVDQIRESPHRDKFIYQLDETIKLLKDSGMVAEKSRPIMRRIIQLKINLSKDLP